MNATSIAILLWAAVFVQCQGARLQDLSKQLIVGIQHDGPAAVTDVDQQPCNKADEVCSLPGFNGRLPVRIRSGYITVGDQSGRQLWYAVVDKEGAARSNTADSNPVILWLTGGPGCSTTDAFIYEHGPFTYSYAQNTVSDEQQRIVLRPNPYAWSKLATMVYVDSPAGTGFSFTPGVAPDGEYHTNDEDTIADLGLFMERLWAKYPELAGRELYVAGESYAGVFVTLLTQELLRRNSQARRSGAERPFNLQGYVLGNPVTDDAIDLNAQYQFAFDYGFIDPPTWKRLRRLCEDNFWNATYGSRCDEALAEVRYTLADLNWYGVLTPCYEEWLQQQGRQRGTVAAEGSVKAAASNGAGGRADPRRKQQQGGGTVAAGASRPSGSVWRPFEARFMPRRDGSGNLLGSEGPGMLGHVVPCADRRLAIDWLNRPEVRKALHAPPPGDIPDWQPCSDYVYYRLDTMELSPLHAEHLRAGLRVLVYSGDHDMVVPHTGTRQWVFGLHDSDDIDEPFGPWYFQKQVAGFTVKFRTGLRYATFKGGAHMVPSSHPEASLYLLDEWLQRRI